MLLQVRAKKAQKKCNKTAIKSFTSVNSITSNPEIQVLLDKLQFMTGEFYEQKPNPLNLVEWGRIKYIPTQSENRIKIQNRISLKKADDEKVRPRIKPIKRYSLSQEKSRKEKPMSYKEHYKAIIQSLNQKKKNMEDQSEEQIIQNKDSQIHSSEGFKYYNNIKKYTHLLSYIQDKINTKEAAKMSRNSIILQKNLARTSKTIHNEQVFGVMGKTSQTVLLASSENQIKIDSIIKKWKPKSRNERKMMTAENRYSSSNRSKTKDLLNSTIKMGSPRYDSELNLELSLEKQQFSQIIRVK